MLTIYPIPAFNDNYIWTIVNQKNREVLVIDAGESQPIINFLQEQSFKLTQIWITHHHHDHIGGVADLVALYPDVQVFAHAQIQTLLPQVSITPVIDHDRFFLWQYPVDVWQVAGHTAEHLAFLLPMDDKLHVFCGDTLFRAGCGRVFTGTIEQLFASFQRIYQLQNRQWQAQNILLYPTHEYSLANLQFAQTFDQNNTAIQIAISRDQQLRAKNLPTLPTSLFEECQINLFLRAVAGLSDEVIANIEQRITLSDYQPMTVFSALRSLKNHF